MFTSTPKNSYDAKAKMTAGSPDFLPCLSKKNQASDDEHEGANITSTELYFKRRIKRQKKTMQAACKHNFVFGLFFFFFNLSALTRRTGTNPKPVKHLKPQLV